MSLPARPADRPLVMGVVNVTPDSFSDGGAYVYPEAAVAHGLSLIRDGADIVDVGGESTRPGAERPSVDDELTRVLPVVRSLAQAGAVVSIDTMRASVAAAALDAGAAIVNDVSGGLADPQMASVAADAGAGFVAMHWRGHSHDMQQRAVYDDVVLDVCSELRSRATQLLDAGIAPSQLVLDPGLGFAKTGSQNWALLAMLDKLKDIGFPLLVGASRKSFLAQIAARDAGPVPAAQRDVATAAVSVVLAQHDVWGVRVHEVRSTRAAFEVVREIRHA